MPDRTSLGSTLLPDALRALHEISLELAVLPDTDSLCRRAVEWGLSHLGFDRLSLWFVDPQDDEWRLGTWGTDERGRLRDERGSRVRRDAQANPAELYAGLAPSVLFENAVAFDDNRHEVGRSDKGLAPLWDGHVIIGEMAADNLISHRTIERSDLEPLVLFARIVAHLHTLIRTRQALARANDEKGTLLRELKHRTRNNLMVIAGLVNLEADRAVHDEARERLGVVRDRVDALGQLYALLDRGADGSQVRLDEYLCTVAERLLEAHGASTRGVTLDADLSPVTAGDQTAASLGLALNELVTDCLKYAFAGGRKGIIRVTLSDQGSTALLEVRDDGPGFPDGFQPDSSGGLGLGLVDAIARQVGGDFRWSTDRGAVFRLTFRPR